MKLYWPIALFAGLVSSLPHGPHCPDERCNADELQRRTASPEIPFIPPIPKPLPVIPPAPKPPVIPVVPHPPAPVIPPKPVDPLPAPKPVDPVPEPPKPVEPVPKPENPKPGDGDDICKRADPVSGSKCSLPLTADSMALFAQKGESSFNRLINIQRDPAATDVKRDFIGDKYEYEQEEALKTNPLDKDEVKFLSEPPIELPGWIQSDKWMSSRIRNPQNINDDPDRFILSTIENTQERAMIIRESRNQEKDKAPDAEKARWSDMAMYNWKQACNVKQARPDSLSYIMQENIMGGESAKRTSELIDQAILKVNGNPSRVNVFRSGRTSPVSSPAERTGFDMIAGSDHVDRVLKMLADYPETMRNVRIDSLSVTTMETDSADEAYNILIKLVKVETP